MKRIEIKRSSYSYSVVRPFLFMSNLYKEKLEKTKTWAVVHSK